MPAQSVIIGTKSQTSQASATSNKLLSVWLKTAMLVLLGIGSGAYAAPPTIELFAGGGITSVNGPTTVAQTNTYQGNLNNPTDNVASTYSPTTTVTYSLSSSRNSSRYSSNSGASTNNPDLMFGGTINNNSNVVTGATVYSPLNGIGAPSNANFAATLQNAPSSCSNGANCSSGTTGGIDVAGNYGSGIFAATKGLDIANLPTNGRYKIGSITVTFNRSVTNPILQVAGLGGTTGSGLGFSAEFDLVSNNSLNNTVSMSRLAGSKELSVTSTRISNNASTITANTGSGGASGSVYIQGKRITSLTFDVYVRGDGGGTDWDTTNTVFGDRFFFGVSSIEADNDLSITKTQRAGTTGTFVGTQLDVIQGSTVQYRLVLANSTTSAVSGATYSDSVPSAITGLSIVSTTPSTGASCAPTLSGNTISGTYNGPSGSTCTIIVKGTATTLGLITNTATLLENATDPDLSNNSSSVNTNIIATTNLAITKTGTTSVKAGQPVSYIIKVWNKGPTAVTDAVMNDVVPNNISGVYLQCTATGTATCGTVTPYASGSNTRTATGISLPVDAAGNTNYVTYTVSGLAYQTGTFSNTATISSAAVPESDSSDNTDSQATTITVDAAVTTGNAANQCLASQASNVLTPITFTGYSDNNTTQTQSMTVNSAGTGYGTATNGAITVNGKISWSYGNPRITAATLTLYINNTAYAVLTTVGASSNGDQATWTALNGATITPATVALGSYSNANTTVPFTLTLPTSVTSVTSGYTEFKNISPTNASNMAGDDIGIAVDSILQCQKSIIKIAKISTGGTGAFNFNGLTNLSNASNTAVTTDSVTTTTAGIATTSSQINYATANNTAIGITEAATTNYALTAASCTDSNSAVTGNTGSFGSLSGTTLSIPAANIKYGANLICTFSNTKQRTLTLRKTWVNARVNDAATITVTGLNSFASVADSASETDTAAAQAVNVGSTITLGENISTGVGLYNAALACTQTSGGAAVALNGNNLTMPDADVTCTYTNTRKSATLTLSKIWSAGSIAGNTVTVTSTGFINNASSGTSTATAAGNTTTGTGVTVYAGETGTISETFGTGNASNYTANLTCSGNSTALTGNSLTINPADTAITCSYTNTVTGADLAIDKTGSSSVTQGSTVSYTIKVWNKGPTLVSSSTFTDTVPAALTNVSWACTANGSAVCGTVSGTGNSISVTTGALPVNNVTTAPTSGSYLTFTVTGTAASVGNISNTASIAVTSGTDPVTTNNTSQATTTVNSSTVITPDPKQKEARFVIAPDLPTIYRGQAGAQLVTIKNGGPDDASGTVATFKPRAQTGVTVTSVKVAGGSACSLSAGSWSCPVGSVANNGSFQLEVSYDTTSSATLGTAIQADIRVNSNEFNPGSGVGESVYHIWGAENQQTIPSTNGAFMVGYNGTGGNVTGSGNGNFGPFSYEGTSIESAWPANQNSPTGGYLDYGISGANSSYYLAYTNSAPPMIDRLINSLAGLSVKLPLINPATNSLVDNRRAWEIRTGALIPTNVPSQQYTLCVGDSSQKLDDSAYIMINGVRQGIARDTYSNTIYTVPVTLNSGYNSISYRIANRNSTNGNGGEVNEGGFSTIGIFTGGNCLTGALDDLINIGQTASINIIEKPQVTITGQVFEDNSGTTTVNSNAYNGIKDAGELAITDSTVTINNCTNTTAIATTQTNANGEYTFSLLPSDLPAGNFCIAQKNLDGYSSVSGTTGYNRVTDQITVSNTGASSYANHNFGDARLNAILTEDGQQTIIAGGVADYPHRLTAQSVLTVTSLGQTSTQQPANSTDAPWQSLLYRDLNCNGKVDAGENLISASLPLSLKANEQVCLVQRVYAPATASMGAQHIGQLQASFAATLADTTQITGTSIKRQDTTLLGSAGLSMQKMVRSVASCPSTAADTTAFNTNNQAQSGGYLEYEITYRNNSLKNLVDISIKDTVPVGTVFKNNTCQITPSSITCSATKTGDALLWQNTGTLLPSQQGKVRFCVQIP